MNIYDHLVKNLCKRTKKLNIPELKLAISMHNQGESSQKICDEFDIPKSTTNWILNEYDKALKKFESKKPEVNSIEMESTSEQNLFVIKTITPRDPCICPPASDLTTNESPWGPVFVFILVLVLLYFFVLRS